MANGRGIRCGTRTYRLASYTPAQPPRHALPDHVSWAALRRTNRRHQLHEMVPLADSTIYEMEQRGEFPRRFALSPRCVVWDLSEVEAWLLLRRSTPLTRAPHPDVNQRRSRPVKVQDRVQRSAPKAE